MHDSCRQLLKKVAHLRCLLLLWPFVNCLCRDRLSTFQGQSIRCRCLRSSILSFLQLQLYMLQSRDDIKEIDNVYKWHVDDTCQLCLIGKVSAEHTCALDGSEMAISVA